MCLDRIFRDQRTLLRRQRSLSTLDRLCKLFLKLFDHLVFLADSALKSTFTRDQIRILLGKRLTLPCDIFQFSNLFLQILDLTLLFLQLLMLSAGLEKRDRVLASFSITGLKPKFELFHRHSGLITFVLCALLSLDRCGHFVEIIVLS